MIRVAAFENLDGPLPRPTALTVTSGPHVPIDALRIRVGDSVSEVFSPEPIEGLLEVSCDGVRGLISHIRLRPLSDAEFARGVEAYLEHELGVVPVVEGVT